MGAWEALPSWVQETQRFQDGTLGGFNDTENMFRSFGGGAPAGPCKAPPMEKKVQCTLEELYNGWTRKMKISRNIVDYSGKSMPVEEILTTKVKLTKIHFHR